MSELVRLETRLDRLESEYSKELANMLEILHKIEQRLVGALDQDSPGIIADVRQLKREVDEVQKVLIQVSQDFKALQELQVKDAQIMSELAEMKLQLPNIWSKIQTYERYRYLILGGLFVLGFLANKGWELYMAAVKKP